jgi:hypothetical protein
MNLLYTPYILVTVGLLVEIFSKQHKYIIKYYYIFIYIYLFIFVAFRPFGIDRDYEAYYGWFYQIINSQNSIWNFLKDPMYAFISLYSNYTGLGFRGVLIIFAFFSIFGKYIFKENILNNNSNLMFIYLIICRIIFPQDMTAIRVAAALPLMSLSIIMAYQNRKLISIFIYILSLLFHLSILLSLPIYLLIFLKVKFDSRRWLIGLFLISLIAYAGVNYILNYFRDFTRLSDYLSGENSVSLISFYFIVRFIAIFYIIIFLWKKLSSINRTMVVVSTFGIAIQVIFSSNAVLALRGSEIFIYFDIISFLIPLEYLSKKLKTIYVLILFCMGIIYLLSSIKLMEGG